MRFLLRFLVPVLAIGGLVFGAWYWSNNRPAAPVPIAVLDTSFEGAVRWLTKNRELILNENHPMLWQMVGESANLSGDPQLQRLYSDFRLQYDRRAPRSVWQAYLAPDRFRGVEIPFSAYGGLVEYQQYFIYASTCAPNMGRDPQITSQHGAQFCWRGQMVLRPTCTTHQLMGLRLAQRHDCGVPGLDDSIHELQISISRQLRFDPRLIDLYIQRALTLVESGAADRLNPRWLERIIAAQLPDGSWDDLDPILFLGDDRYFGFTSRGFAVRNRSGRFHATAQGVLLMSLLRGSAAQSATNIASTPLESVGP